MTAADFARHMNVKRSTVTYWKKKSFLVYDQGDDGQQYIDVAKTEQFLADRMGRKPASKPAAPVRKVISSGRQTGVAPPEPAQPKKMTQDDAKTAEILSRITKNNLANARAAGELVPLQEYTALATKLGRGLRDGLQALGHRVMDRFAAEADPRQIYLTLMQEADVLLADLADQVEHGMLGESTEMDDEEVLEEELERATEPDE